MENNFVAILINSAGKIIDAITDGVDDGIIIITDCEEWFEDLRDLTSSFFKMFK